MVTNLRICSDLIERVNLNLKSHFQNLTSANCIRILKFLKPKIFKLDFYE